MINEVKTFNWVRLGVLVVCTSWVGVVMSFYILVSYTALIDTFPVFAYNINANTIVHAFQLEKHESTLMLITFVLLGFILRGVVNKLPDLFDDISHTIWIIKYKIRMAMTT